MNGNLLDYKKLFDCLDTMLFIVDEDGYIITCNSAVESHLGYTRYELSGVHVSKIHPESRLDQVNSVMTQFKSQDAITCSIPVLNKSGEEILVLTQLYKGTWEGKQVALGFCRDITHESEVELKCRAIFDNSPLPIAITKLSDGCIINVNDAWLKLFGYEKDDVIGKTTHELNSFESLDVRTSLVGKLDPKGASVELKSQSGKILSGLFYATKIILDHEYCWVTMFVDRTEIRDARIHVAQDLLSKLHDQISNNKYIKIDK